MIQLTNQAFTVSKNNKIKNFFLSAALKVDYGYEKIYRRNTDMAVFIFAVIFAAIVGLLDFGLDKLFREVILK